jgi:hypothetical protein
LDPHVIKLSHCFWSLQHLAPPGSAATQTSAISAPLRDAINATFGTVDNVTAELTAAAGKVFGSGWAWLCYTGTQGEKDGLTLAVQCEVLQVLLQRLAVMLHIGMQCCVPDAAQVDISSQRSAPAATAAAGCAMHLLEHL